MILICSTAGFSQVQGPGEHRFIFNGIIRDATTLEPLPNTQIFVQRSFVSASEQDGTFAVSISRGDTLAFRLLGYQPAYLYVSDTLAGKEFLAGVYMKTDTLSIGEVIIVPRQVNLRTELFRPPAAPNQEMENARYNMAVSSYQGKMSVGKLGDPASNYSVVHQQMRTYAFEKGTIPSDRIVGFSPFMLVPAAYLLINGFPQKPAAMKPNLTRQELEQLHQRYLESKGIKE
ncbi:MAG TPA: hypothetical protein PLX08_01145 [Bacteroidales bacterium]|jgi:hypothetical protein|nr:hypothetical protein [Bacteroidales bacterium]